MPNKCDEGEIGEVLLFWSMVGLRVVEACDTTDDLAVTSAELDDGDPSLRVAVGALHTTDADIDRV
ncbi:MAG: hypothetical protein GEU79_12365 [Acidimicrobiia bacterium]|nr:hypothetical protein [Acidimicrobiia bacterium]